jgi:hypothetical protein
MKIPGTARWLQQGAGAVLMVSVGVLIGARGNDNAVQRPDSPGVQTMASPARVDSVAAAGLDTGGVAATPREPSASLQIPSAPGFESVLAAGSSGDTAASFAGSYAVLRGATTADGGANVQLVSTAPSTTPASRGEEAASALSTTSSAGAPALDTTASAPGAGGATGFRPSPAQGLPRGIALRHPMLAIIRPGGRAVMYDLGMGGGPTPAGLEGEWAVIGDCSRRVRVEFTMRSRRVGEVQGVGRLAGGAAWSGEPVVATQACAAASDRFVRPSDPSSADRAQFEKVAGDAGFAGWGLQEVVAGRSFDVLVFRQEGRRRSLIVVRARNGGAPAVLKEVEGEVRLLGVYRSGSGATAWFAVGAGDVPESVVVARSGDLRSWDVLGPNSLQAQ